MWSLYRNLTNEKKVVGRETHGGYQQGNHKAGLSPNYFVLHNASPKANATPGDSQNKIQNG